MHATSRPIPVLVRAHAPQRSTSVRELKLLSSEVELTSSKIEVRMSMIGLDLGKASRIHNKLQELYSFTFGSLAVSILCT